MKRVTLILFVIVSLSSKYSHGQNVSIPDGNFLQTLVNLGVDINSDGIIQSSEAGAVAELTISNAGISDLTGIEAFINLDTLDCSFNQLTALDISLNTKLTLLYCAINKLKGLDLSNQTALKYLSCSNNQLASLTVSNNPGLIILDCGFNNLTNLDVLADTSLEILECYSNRLESLNLSENTHLVSLYCDNNKIGSLDLSGNPDLKLIDCQYNSLLNINLTYNAYLTDLACFSNQLTSLDLTKNTRLARLDCGMNLYTSLDLSKNDSLVSADCSQNPELKYICVRDTDHVNSNFNFIKDNTAQWTESCNETTGVVANRAAVPFQLNPNPGKDQFTLSLQQPAYVRILNSGGQEIESFANVENLQFGENYLQGVYFVHLILPGSKNGAVIKIVKE